MHLGPLPNYKGGLSSFWLLRNSEKYAGSSIHIVTPRIDEGGLIDEVRFEINTNSMNELMTQNILAISERIPKTISSIFNNRVKFIDTSSRKSFYYLYPTREDFIAFYRNKCRLI